MPFQYLYAPEFSVSLNNYLLKFIRGSCFSYRWIYECWGP